VSCSAWRPTASCACIRLGRRARRGPDEGRRALEHRFVSDHEYDDLDAAGFFLGTVTLPGLPYRYGLPPLALAGDGPIDTIMARVAFLDALAPHVPVRLTYQIEDTPERARRRLLARGNDAIELGARLDGARTKPAPAARSPTACS
jgi:hypothetical protein